MGMSMKTVLLDVKAVLLDMTETIHTLDKERMLNEFKEKLWERYFPNVGFNEFKTAYFQAYSYYQVGLISNDKQFFKMLAKTLGCKFPGTEIKKLIHLHQNLRVHFIKLMPDVIPTLNYLKKKGYKLAMVSNCVRNWADKDFKRMRFNPNEFFDVQVSSQNTHYLKPNPRAFLAAIKKLRVKPEECVYIGDDIIDINGAKYTGIKIRILFEKPTQVCHYVEHIAGTKSPTTADYVIQKLSDIRKIL